jgi:transcriptional regulator with XRE-family HTH domain
MLAPDRIESSTDTIKRQQVLRSLEDREYRREFAADVGTGLAFQVRLLREARGWTQEQLAHQMGKRQETICQWENPNYGRYTLKTLDELAAAFDVALLVRFAPFRELVDWLIDLTPERLAPPPFEEELPSLEHGVIVARVSGQRQLWATNVVSFEKADGEPQSSPVGVLIGSAGSAGQERISNAIA